MVRRESIRGLALAACALVGVIPGRAPAYIDIPPATLGRMCESTMSFTLMRVEEIDAKRGRVIFRAVRDLKGNGPSDLAKHAVGLKAGGGKEVLAWAKKGTRAVHFASASRGYSYTYLDGHWYSATLSGGWWHL